MKDRNNKHFSSGKNEEDKMSGKSYGAQGVDKAPGEETSGDTENVVVQTQIGKNKVDGDPSQESDQPIENEQ